ncbi:MAG TPA: phosphoribosylformylglycinamidine cyclo-ligase [Solirubrobacteraceae bacterium]|jgi:phosphoribosylformylglycinamidine cyclo-ligase|nr:phosphoribosylformylglycinamidine cyclo-ligase [Solirubrobacteraceae bacterium]
MSDAYASAGVDTGEAGRGLQALVSVLGSIELGRPSRSRLESGHYANVLEVAPNLGIAMSTDGVGSKLLVAEQTGRLDTVGIDCIAMNVNDVVCVGAEPIAVLDYLAVERVDAGELEQIAIGLKRGAEQAGVEIPGGELAVLPELIRGHPSPHGFDLCGACVGTVALDRMVTGAACEPGDALIGLPSSGLHSNGYTLARRVLLEEAGLGLEDRPDGLGGASVADALLAPTVIYVRAIVELLRSSVPVHGLAHITGDGVLNLLRVGGERVGFTIEQPLAVPAVCSLVCERGSIGAAEAYQVFNMGCGFVAIVPGEKAGRAVDLLARHHRGAAVIGKVTEQAGCVSLPGLGLAGGPSGLHDAG